MKTHENKIRPYYVSKGSARLKKSPKHHCVCFVLVACYSPFSVDCSPREIPLVKTNSFFVSGYSQFWVRDRSLCLFLISGTTLLTLCRRSECGHSVYESACASPVCPHASFSWCPPPPLTLHSFHFLFCRVP